MLSHSYAFFGIHWLFIVDKKFRAQFSPTTITRSVYLLEFFAPIGIAHSARFDADGDFTVTSPLTRGWQAVLPGVASRRRNHAKDANECTDSTRDSDSLRKMLRSYSRIDRTARTYATIASRSAGLRLARCAMLFMISGQSSTV